MDAKIGSGELNTKTTFSEQFNLSDHSNNLSGLIEPETNQVIMSTNESDIQEKMSLNGSNQVVNIQMVNTSYGDDFPEKSQIIPESYDNIKIIATKDMTGADYVNDNLLQLIDSTGQNYLHIEENPVIAISNNNVYDPARTSDIKNEDASTKNKKNKKKVTMESDNAILKKKNPSKKRKSKNEDAGSKKTKLNATESTKLNATESTIKELKCLISEQAAEIEKLLDLNKGLQEKVLDKMDEYASRQINPYSCRIRGDIPVGYIRTDTNQIYCGNDVWMNLTHYYQAKNNAASGKPNTEYNRFVKTVAEFIFGKDELARCSVKGQRCNAIKGSIAKPALDSRNLSAVHDIFAHYLEDVRKKNTVEIYHELQRVGEYINSKMSDLQPKKKRATAKKKSAAPPNSKNAKKPDKNVNNDKDPENSIESETANSESSESSDDGSDDEINEESDKETDRESDKESDKEDAESTDRDSSADDDSNSNNSEHE
ncbi:uncharacterized protein LOC111694656 [Trichogramma pretiosum]|uniref:uncharacterized protein LOC111694656 n=1 Tax=Trichogramma pretiosum TaxID=7493 RepID=UPI000C71B867|nr:uncharacterized protein LOC111694656 [Trichogramma pretiosum]